MEFQQVIESRRSIRAFAADKKVERNVVEELLKGASLAPSWKNSQSARYYVAMTPEMVKAVRECLPAYNQRSSQNAPVLVVTAFEKGNAGFIEGTPSDSLGDAWGCYDHGAAGRREACRPPGDSRKPAGGGSDCPWLSGYGAGYAAPEGAFADCKIFLIQHSGE